MSSFKKVFPSLMGQSALSRNHMLIESIKGNFKAFIYTEICQHYDCKCLFLEVKLSAIVSLANNLLLRECVNI